MGAEEKLMVAGEGRQSGIEVGEVCRCYRIAIKIDVEAEWDGNSREA